MTTNTTESPASLAGAASSVLAAWQRLEDWNSAGFADFDREFLPRFFHTAMERLADASSVQHRPATVGLEVLGDEDDEPPDAWHLGHHHGATLDPDAHLAASDAGWPPGISPAFIAAYDAGFHAGWNEADPARHCPTCGADILGNDPHEPGCETGGEA